MILAWGAVAFGGVGAAPYALAAILAVQYLLFFMPDTESSFRNARDKMSAHIVRSSMRAIRVYVGEGGGWPWPRNDNFWV